MNLQTFKRRLALSILKTAFFAMMTMSITDCYAQHSKNYRVNIGLLYPLSSNWTGAALDTNTFSLNLLAGVSAAEHGISLSGISNIIRKNAKGLQIAGFSNHIGRNSNGTLVAGFLNTYSRGKAVAVAGFANISSNGDGSQIGGFLNKTASVSSLQLSGFTNIAKEVEGIQIAGFLNVAKKVRGVQLGFINIADSARSQIGIINISKNSTKSLGVIIDENQTTMLTFRSGGKTLYGIIGAGYNVNNKRDEYAFEAGLGTHLLRIKLFTLNTELVGGGMQSQKGGEYFKSSFRVMPSLKLTPSIEIIGGPSINYVNTDTEEGRKMNKNYIYSWLRNNGHDLNGFYFGYSAGIQIAF